MSIQLYDKALIEKLSNWTRNTQMHIFSPDETKRVFEVNADKRHDKPIQLPMICVKRPGGFTILNTGKRPITFDGLTLDSTYELSSQLNAIPISIPYQIDIYTRYQNECDEYIRNIVFNIINYPKLDIVIPYNNRNYIHHSNIRLQPDVSDNSSIPERLIPGQFTRQTLKVDIDDAYLFDVRYREVYSISEETIMSDNDIKDDSKDITLK